MEMHHQPTIADSIQQALDALRSVVEAKTSARTDPQRILGRVTRSGSSQVWLSERRRRFL
jgi:hypothetical protein